MRLGTYRPSRSQTGPAWPPPPPVRRRRPAPPAAGTPPLRDEAGRQRAGRERGGGTGGAGTVGAAREAVSAGVVMGAGKGGLRVWEGTRGGLICPERGEQSPGSRGEGRAWR